MTYKIEPDAPSINLLLAKLHETVINIITEHIENDTLSVRALVQYALGYDMVTPDGKSSYSSASEYIVTQIWDNLPEDITDLGSGENDYIDTFPADYVSLELAKAGLELSEDYSSQTEDVFISEVLSAGEEIVYEYVDQMVTDYEISPEKFRQRCGDILTNACLRIQGAIARQGESED